MQSDSSNSINSFERILGSFERILSFFFSNIKMKRFLQNFNIYLKISTFHKNNDFDNKMMNFYVYLALVNKT